MSFVDYLALVPPVAQLVQTIVTGQAPAPGTPNPTAAQLVQANAETKAEQTETPMAPKEPLTEAVKIPPAEIPAQAAGADTPATKTAAS